jgi:serine/threonine protein kinase
MQDDALLGRRLGAYQIQTLLGEGGMARVYKAYHVGLQREVAIKVIQPDRAGLDDFQVRFEQEARLIARLQHRNIVTVYDYGESESMVYLVMQYVAGGTLYDQLRAGQPLEPRRAALYALQVARALHHAHQRDIVHRDVKPLNMLISASNRNELLLSDFGLAKVFAANSETLFTTSLPDARRSDQTLSQIGSIIGTPRYMAPEQCLSMQIDGRTDIYALGVVLFEMITGQPPFRATTTQGLLYHHAYTPVPPVHELNPAAPESLARIALRALEKRPEARYQSAKDMAVDLERVLAPSTSVALHPPSSLPRTKRRVKAYYFALAVVVVLGILQLAVSAGLLHWPAVPVHRSAQVGAATPPSACTSTHTSAPAQSFVETFQDDHRGWQLGSLGDITSVIQGETYTLQIANKNSAFFLCPSLTSVGTLPENFSLSAQMQQRQGSLDVYYGLAFHLSYDKDTNAIAGYAFVMNGRGTCALLKYDPHVAGGYTILKSQPDVSAIHPTASNTLQVIVQGSRQSFKIDNTVIPFNGTGQADQSISDASYTGGQLALLVSGPDTSFTISSVALTVS